MAIQDGYMALGDVGLAAARAGDSRKHNSKMPSIEDLVAKTYSGTSPVYLVNSEGGRVLNTGKPENRYVPKPVQNVEVPVVNKPAVVDVPKQVATKQAATDEAKYLGGLISRYGSLTDAVKANPKLVNMANPTVKSMLANEAEWAAQAKPMVSTVQEEIVEPIAKPVEAGMNGLAAYSAAQKADMTRVADEAKMARNPMYAEAVGKLFGY